MTASMTVAPRRRSAHRRGWKAGPFGEHPSRLGAVQSYSQAPAQPTQARRPVEPHATAVRVWGAPRTKEYGGFRTHADRVEI